MAKKNKLPSTKHNDKAENKLLSSLITSSIIVLVITAICFTYLAIFERPTLNEASIDTQAQTLAQSQASILDQALNQLRTRLISQALNDELLTALENNDLAAIARFEQEIERAFPKAVSSRLIKLGPLGIATIDTKTAELRNNIEFDLLRAVSSDGNVEPEAYRHKGKWLFSLAEPIKAQNNDYTSAALLVTLDEEYLRTLLGQLDNAQGYTTLTQRFGNKENIIAATGDTSNARVTIDTSVSHWLIGFTPSAEMIANSRHSASIIWILFAASVLSILGAAVFLNLSVQKALNDNLAQLADGQSEDFNLPGFREAAAAMRNSTGASTATAASAPPETPPLTEATATTTEETIEAPAQEDTASPSVHLPAHIPETIFRAYDIRGLADEELTDDNVFAIGLAIGSQAHEQGQQTVVVAADGRHSSPRIRDAMIKGLQASGRDVIDIGIMPTPLMYFATHHLDSQTGVMITGSHNPPEYNGIKIVIDGRALAGPAITQLHKRILNNTMSSGTGTLQNTAVDQDYIDYIINDVAIAQPLKIVIDAGNGVAGAIAPALFEELGCEVIPLYCDVDGDFPNHHPDPTVEANLQDLKLVVKEQEADLGIAFDGDGDRLGVVTGSGNTVAADRLLMLFAQDVVSRNPGADVLFDVKCTRNLNALISNFGGRPIMWKTGHSFMKEKMAETGALLGGEYSGHIFFKERWFGFDDGMYAAARLIEILSTSDPDLDVQLEAFPVSINSPELKVETGEERKFDIIEQLIEKGQFSDGKISTLDGVRVEFSDGWGLVRASNTTPMLILRFEADSDDALQRIQNLFKEQLSAIDNHLQYSF